MKYVLNILPLETKNVASLVAKCLGTASLLAQGHAPFVSKGINLINMPYY